MKTAIMQPYFFPYIGYFQLIAAVDLFVVYDNIKYTKKGWINRNRILNNGRDALISLPLQHGSDYLDVQARALAADFDGIKVLNQITGAYRRAPYFAQTFPLLEQVMRHEDRNLYAFLLHSIVRTCRHLGIPTEIRTSSDIAIDHSLKSQEKVLALCGAVGARIYVNSFGGTELYSKDKFRDHGLELKFLRSKPFTYDQFVDTFVPWLSIIDVMMFNPRETIRDTVLSNYELV